MPGRREAERRGWELLPILLFVLCAAQFQAVSTQTLGISTLLNAGSCSLCHTSHGIFIPGNSSCHLPGTSNVPLPTVVAIIDFFASVCLRTPTFPLSSVLLIVSFPNLLFACPTPNNVPSPALLPDLETSQPRSWRSQDHNRYSRKTIAICLIPFVRLPLR